MSLMRLISVIRTIINATHEVHFGRFYWWEDDEPHDFTLLGLGWGTFTLLTMNGSPRVGVQISYSKLAVWFGPWHRRFGL